MIAPPARPNPARSAAVYLLPHLEQPRFKIDWSMRPNHRVRFLPEHADVMLDLSKAQIAWFREATRCRQVEQALHRGLAPYGVEVEHRGDGRTEWFHVRAMTLARRMLTILATSEDGRTGGPLRGIHQRPGWEQGEPELVVGAERAEGADEVWSRVEDLWWRLRFQFPLAVNVREAELLWRGLKRLPLWDIDLLRVRALNLETYQWWDDGRKRSLVSRMD